MLLLMELDALQLLGHMLAPESILPPAHVGMTRRCRRKRLNPL
jgi:hypothetical protein